MSDACLLVFITVPDRERAETIAESLVADRHAACVTVIGGATAFYRWEGQLHRDAETLLLAKTTRAAFDGLRTAVLSLHSEELPELIAVPVTDGLSAYLQWVDSETRWHD